MNMNFKRKLPIPMDIKEQYPCTPELEKIKIKRDEEIKAIFENKDNINILKGIPISGICVVSAIMKAENPRKATMELIERAKELRLW